jgi:ParB/RepB/Spo0J family partition protein
MLQAALIQAVWGMLVIPKEKNPMTTTHAPVLDVQDEDIREVSPASAVLWRRLGLEALPNHETMLLQTDRLVVAGADGLVRSAKRLVKSIQHVGILQTPSVVVQGGVDIHDAEASFEVIAGRRRVLAARLAGLPVVKCEVYSASTMPLSALLALIENEQRSAAWVREVEALRCLIDEGVGMTLDDLAAFGFDRSTLAERLKIAQLPVPILNRVLAGVVNREVARRLTRLTQAQQERVANLALGGEEITAERVKDILRVQIDAGLVPVQSALAQGWDAPPSGIPALSEPSLQRSLSTPVCEEQAGHTVDAGKERAPEAYPTTATSSMSSLLVALHAFAQSPDYRRVPQTVQTLTQALAQQLRVALRDALPATQPHATVELQSREGGARNHV